MENEIWKDILGYEGLYQASNLGRIKSLKRKFAGERILKLATKTIGYKSVGLSKDGVHIQFNVHCLVWEAFNGKIPEGFFINHINEDKGDNRLINLMLTTPKENDNWGTRNERISKSKTNGKRSKPVLQFDLNGKLVKEWPSTREIKRQLNYSQGNISSCCISRTHHKTAYGYIWKFKED